jgi:hypothetical protein
MKHITTEDALRALEEAVAEKGEDYIYPEAGKTCYYALDGAPSCLVGNALHRLGYSILQLEEFRSHPICSLPADVPMEDRALDAFIRAQEAQDAGAPWGEALHVAREAVTPDA